MRFTFLREGNESLEQLAQGWDKSSGRWSPAATPGSLREGLCGTTSRAQPHQNCCPAIWEVCVPWQTILHRITGLEGTLNPIHSTPCHGQGHLPLSQAAPAWPWALPGIQGQPQLLWARSQGTIPSQYPKLNLFSVSLNPFPVSCLS